MTEEPEQWDDFKYFMTVANTLRLPQEQPDRVKATLDALYERIGNSAQEQTTVPECCCTFAARRNTAGPRFSSEKCT